VNDQPPRRPGGAARLLLLASTAAGFFAVFSVGFPPASRDRLPVFAAALGLTLLSAWSPNRGLVAFAFLFPLAGAADRALGGADAVAWPVLLFAGFAGGWTFRFLYDFENVPDSSRIDGALRAVLGIWLAAALLAFVRARTLWALTRSLRLRAVNVEGLPDADAVRDSLLTFAALAVGAAFFFILRRSGASARARALSAALLGCAVSGALAAFEKLSLAPGEVNAFWKMTGRLSGGAIDPNALGILCALGLAVAASALAGSHNRGGRWIVIAAALSAGLVLSGSRSAVLLLAAALVFLLAAPGLPARRRIALAVAGLAILIVVGGFLARTTRGSVASRVALFFDRTVSTESRVSTRTVLWQSAWRLFEKKPVAGAGLGAFPWQLPNLLAEEGRTLPLRDNPGNAYLQSLAETGILGFALMMLLVFALAREALAALKRGSAAGVGAAILGFLVALFFGSHWLAPDVSLFFFLLAAVAARPRDRAASPVVVRARRLAIAGYAAAAVVAASSTVSSDEAFRYRPAIGFHGRENGKGGPFYWTRRRFAIRVEPGRSVRMGLAHFTPESKPVELVAVSDDREVLRRTLAPGEGSMLLLAAGGTRPRVIEFALSRAYVPRRLGLSSDRRELGLMAFFPAQAP
jgi:O-antigen ligase